MTITNFDEELLKHYQRMIDNENMVRAQGLKLLEQDRKIKTLETAIYMIREEVTQKRCKVLLLVEQITELFGELVKELIRL